MVAAACFALAPTLAFAASPAAAPAPHHPAQASPARRPPAPAHGPLPAPIRPAAPVKTVLSLAATFGKGLHDIRTGLRWRVFLDQPDAGGNYALVVETTEPRPLLALEPGGYIVDVAYGLVSQTRRVILGSVTASERFDLDCGALRFVGVVDGRPIPAAEISFVLHRMKDGIESAVTSPLKSGEIVRLPAGSYQVSSRWGGANARIISEIKVEPGELTDATVHHKAAHVRLRLQGGSAADAAWNVLTPGGDAVVALNGRDPDVVLAEGDYTAVVRTGGASRQQTFAVKSGQPEVVTVAMQ
ncbi:MAG TPA: hypothetical protein VHD15_02210 [Hyphomicrobiales bacterium]|nr:hypothetical protein [Hyphomicrobiales bacterium]